MLASLLAKPTLFLDPQCSLAAGQPPAPQSHSQRSPHSPGISVCIYKHTLLSDVPLGHFPDGSTGKSRCSPRLCSREKGQFKRSATTFSGREQPAPSVVGGPAVGVSGFWRLNSSSASCFIFEDFSQIELQKSTEILP